MIQVKNIYSMIGRKTLALCQEIRNLTNIKPAYVPAKWLGV